MQKFVTNLWFDDQAEEAAQFYLSLFDDSRITRTLYYGESVAKRAGKEKGSVLTVDFQLGGQDFTAINGGPEFRFTEAISVLVNCKTQEEIDRLWEALSEGGEKGECGWLKDKYGLSWQIVPEMLNDLIADPDSERSERAMNAMLDMQKLDIAALERAYKQA